MFSLLFFDLLLQVTTTSLWDLQSSRHGDGEKAQTALWDVTIVINIYQQGLNQGLYILLQHD